MAKKQTDLAKKPPSDLAKSAEVNSMFGNEPPILIDVAPPQMKILREAGLFEMPNGQKVEEVTGHVIYWHNANQYYKVAYEDRKPEDSPFPNCLSTNGLTPDSFDEDGYNQENDQCGEAGVAGCCPLNEYGTCLKGGDGKACQNTIRIAFLKDNDVVPILLKAPPTSVGKKESLKRWIVNTPNESNAAGCGNAYQVIHVKLTLIEKTYSGNLPVSVLVVETLNVLNFTDNAEEINKLAAITTTFKESYLTNVADHMAAEKDGVAEPEVQEEPPI